MAVAVVQDWTVEGADRSTPNYDAVSERLQQQDEPPAGLLVHTAGFTGNRFRIFEVWESKDAFERFVQDRLMPIVNEAAGPGASPPEVTAYDLHAFMATPQ
jgi:hypothetical protein